MKMDRRDFMKLLGIGGFAVVTHPMIVAKEKPVATKPPDTHIITAGEGSWRIEIGQDIDAMCRTGDGWVEVIPGNRWATVYLENWPKLFDLEERYDLTFDINGVIYKASGMITCMSYSYTQYDRITCDYEIEIDGQLESVDRRPVWGLPKGESLDIKKAKK